MGVDPRRATANSAITRPRSRGSELSWSVALDSEIIATLAAPTSGMRRYTREIVGIAETARTSAPNDPATTTSRVGVGGPLAATSSPPPTAPRPISAVIVASPPAPAPNVSSDSSGRVVVNSKVNVPTSASMTSVVRSVGVLQAYRKPSRSWPGARAVRAAGRSSPVRTSSRATITAP